MNGYIFASGSTGAGIGSGSAHLGVTTVTDLAILGGSISAASLVSGAGIGAGTASNWSSSTVATLRIANARITASGQQGAGIGVGWISGAFSTLPPTARAQSAKSTTDTLILSGSLFLACNGSLSAIQASKIVASDVSIMGQTRSPPYFGSGLSVNGQFELAIMYYTATTGITEQYLSLPGLSYLQVGRAFLPLDWTWDMCLWSPLYAHPFLFDSSRTLSFLSSVIPNQNYLIAASLDRISVRLDSDTSSSFFVGPAPLFVPEVHWVLQGTATQSQTPSTSLSPAPSQTPGPAGLSIEVIVGISIGGAAALIIVTVLILCSLKRRAVRHDSIQMISVDSAVRLDGADPIGSANLLSTPNYA
jgi:hypothetical protein